MLSHVQLFATPWTVACQAPLSMGFSRQEYWSELSCPPPEDLPNPGIEPGSPALQADSLPPKLSGKPISPSCVLCRSVISNSLQLHGLQPTRLLCPRGFSAQYWSGLSCPLPGDLPKPGTEPMSPALHVDSLPGKPVSPVKEVKVAQSSLTLCDPMDCSPWNSPGQNT